MAIHQFERRFAEADEPEVVERVREILVRDLDAVDVVRASVEEDKRGVDWWAERACGRRQGVDLKNRRADWGDVHIEYVSRVAEGKPGWTVDRAKITDYVLWLWPKRYLLLPFPLLQATVRRNLGIYRATYATADAQSASATSTWKTQGLGIPIGVLFRDMFGVPAPVGTPLTPPRLCPACHREHPVGTTCATGWAP